MDAEVFLDELKGRFLPYGSVNTAFNNNTNNYSLSIDYIWLEDKTCVKPRILNLQTLSPIIYFDVDNHLSMSYTLGTATSTVIENAKREYSSLETLDVIKRDAILIQEAYNIALDYDKATLFFSQYAQTGRSDSSLVQKARNMLKGYTLYSQRCKQLMMVIEQSMTES